MNKTNIMYGVLLLLLMVALLFAAEQGNHVYADKGQGPGWSNQTGPGMPGDPGGPHSETIASNDSPGNPGWANKPGPGMPGDPGGPHSG